MTSIYEEGVYTRDKPTYDITLNSNNISSLEIREKWSGGCILDVYMNSGRKYVRRGDCEILRQVAEELKTEIRHKYPSTCTFKI